MNPTAVVFSGTIAAPAEAVFDLLTTLRSFADWLPGCESANAAVPTLGKGTHFRLIVRSRDEPREVELEVIEFAAPTTLGWTELAPRQGAKTFFKLQFAGGSTNLTMKHVSTARGLGGRLRAGRFSRRRVERYFDAMLQNLRRAVGR